MGKNYSKLYRAYAEMQNVLKDDYTYNYLKDAMRDGDTGGDSHKGEVFNRVIDMEWVEAIEEALPYIDKAIEEQRRSIIQREEVVRVEKVKKVGPETVKHLSQHTNFIDNISPNGEVIPNKLLNVYREDTYAIYENRLVFTLLNNLSAFIAKRFSNLKDAPADSMQEMHMTRDIEMHNQKVKFNFDFVDENHEKDEYSMEDDVEQLTDFDRVSRIRQLVNVLLNTELMKELVGCIPVRPPITYTNLLKKNPNFAKAVELWHFIETYNKSGYIVEQHNYDGEMDTKLKEELYGVMAYNQFVVNISTNEGLKELLHEKYLEENAKMADDAMTPEIELKLAFEEKLKAMRQEEMNIRLNEIREREKEINKLKGLVAELKTQLEVKEETIKELRKLLAEKMKEIDSLNQKIFALEEKIEELKEIIEKQKHQIEQLLAEVKMLRTELAKAQEEIENLLSEVKYLKKDIEKLTAQVAELTEMVRVRDIKIAEQEAQIEDLTGQVNTLSATLDKERAEHKEQIETMTKAHADEVRDMTEKHQAKVKSMTEAHELEVNNLNTAHQKEVSDMTIAHNAKVSQMTDSFNLQISTLKDDHSKEISNMTAEHSAEVNRLNSKYDDDMLALQNKHTSEVTAINATYEAKLAKSNSDHSAEISSLNNAHQKTVDSMNKSFEEQKKKLANDTKSQIESINADKEKSLATQSANNNKLIAKMNKEKEALLKKETTRHDSEIKRLTKEKDRAYEEEEKKFNARLRELERSLKAEYNRKVAKIKSESNQKIKKAQQDKKDFIINAKKKIKQNPKNFLEENPDE